MPQPTLPTTATQSLSPFAPGPHEQNGFVPYFVSNPPRTPPAEPPPPDPTPPPTPLTDRNPIAIPLSPRSSRAKWLRSVFRLQPAPDAPSGTPAARSNAPANSSHRPQLNRYPPFPQTLTSKLASFRIPLQPATGRPSGPHAARSNAPANSPTDRNPIAIPPFPQTLTSKLASFRIPSPTSHRPRSGPHAARSNGPSQLPPPNATPSLSPLSSRSLRAKWLRSVFRLQPATGRPSGPTPPAPTPPPNSPHRTQPNRYPPLPQVLTSKLASFRIPLPTCRRPSQQNPAAPSNAQDPAPGPPTRANPFQWFEMEHPCRPNSHPAAAAASLSPLPQPPHFPHLRKKLASFGPSRPAPIFHRRDGNYWQDCNKSPRCMKLN